jgi:hypothetical protein
MAKHVYFMSSCAECGEPRRARKDTAATLCRSCAMTKDGNWKSGLSDVYRSMMARCDLRPNGYQGHGHYLARGITVCAEWARCRDVFYRWAKENGWKKGLFLDRIDVNGNYSPENCRFISPAESAQNRTNNVLTADIVISARKRRGDGESCASIARSFGVHPATLADAVARRTWSNV